MRKESSLLKRYFEDNTIIVAIVGSIGPSAQLINVALGLAQGSTWDIVLKAITVLFPVAALILFIRKNHKLASQLKSKPIPICFVTDRTAEDAQQDFEKLKNAIDFAHWDKIEGFNTRSSCLMPWGKTRLPPDINEWKRYISESLQNVRNFVYAVQGTKVYHIAIHGPASLAIGLGAAFGTKYPLIFYHFQKDIYEPVLDLTSDPRLIKERLPENHQYRYFEIMSPGVYTPDTSVILGGASHDDRAFVGSRQYLKEQGKNWSIVEVHNKYGGNLKEKDWLPAVRELFSVFQNLSREKAIRRFHVFYALPIPLGFGLGMALGPFMDITLYNFEKEHATYYPVLKLNELGLTY